MGEHITPGQIREIIDIDRARGGIRTKVQELITRLTSGGVGVKTDDPREVQAKVLWDKGLGRKLGFGSFKAYLATIPEVPEDLLAEDERFPELVLVDARLGLKMICNLLDMDYSGDDQTFEDFDTKKAKTEKVYWIRCQDGRKNDGKSVNACRQQFTKDEVGLTAHEGLALFVQNPQGLKNRAMDLPGSIHCGSLLPVACLICLNERPLLFWLWGGRDVPLYGSGSRRE